MPTPPSNIATVIDLEVVEAGDVATAAIMIPNAWQNIAALQNTHAHAGAFGDGAALAVADPKAIWFYSNPAGSPLT